MLIGDTATTITAAFAAVAAIAAWATVATEWWRQRRAHRPNVSAGFLDHRGTGRQQIEFVNAGPGLAIQLGYLLYAGTPGGQRQGGVVGTGHLQPGERKTVEVNVPVTGKTVDFIWLCRDIDQRDHLWSYDGRRRQLRKGQYPNLGEAFTLMYPNSGLTPRNIGMAEDPTAPGSATDMSSEHD